MMLDNRQIADDLGKHASQEMQEVLNRHMAVAQSVLPPPEIAQILLMVANGVAMGAALYSMQVSRDDVDPAELFDMTAAAIPKLMAIGKPILLAEFAKRGRVTERG